MAQYNLGCMFEQGQGVERNSTKAALWHRRAAEQGDPDAQTSLGHKYLNGEGVKRDVRKAIHWFRKAAEQGHADAQLNLGAHYYLGEGLRRNDAEAVRLFRLSAEQHCPEAQANLGRMYHEGQGVARDDREAVRLLRLAAEQGLPDAQRDLGTLIVHGLGTKKNLIEAYKWLDLAAANSSDGAVGLRERLAEEMTPKQIAARQAMFEALTAKPGQELTPQAQAYLKQTGASETKREFAGADVEDVAKLQAKLGAGAAVAGATGFLPLAALLGGAALLAPKAQKYVQNKEAEKFEESGFSEVQMQRIEDAVAKGAEKGGSKAKPKVDMPTPLTGSGGSEGMPAH